MKKTANKIVPKRKYNVRKLALSKRRLRIAIQGRKGVLDKIDRRTMRRLGVLLDRHVADLGGEDAISHGERVLADRCAMMVLLAELQEADFVAQNLKVPATELASYLSLNSALTRNLQTLGLHRRAKQVPRLQQYLREKEKEADGVEPAE